MITWRPPRDLGRYVANPRPTVMKRAFKFGAIVSGALLATQLVLGIWAMSPRSRQSFSISDTLHCSLWGSDDAMVGPLIFYNDEQVNNLRSSITSVGGVMPREGDALGIYYWYLPLSDEDTFWTVTVSVWYPIILSAILPSLALLRVAIRRRCRFSIRTLTIVILLVAFYFGSWSLTSHLGTRDVLAKLNMKYREDGSTKMNRNPRDDDEYFESLDPDWHYLGNASSTAPFIVAYDDARGFISPCTDNYIGGCDRGYYLWLFGLKIPLDYWRRPGWMFL